RPALAVGEPRREEILHHPWPHASLAPRVQAALRRIRRRLYLSAGGLACRGLDDRRFPRDLGPALFPDAPRGHGPRVSGGPALACGLSCSERVAHFHDRREALGLE